MSGLLRMALVAVMAVVFGVAGWVASAEAAVSVLESFAAPAEIPSTTTNNATVNYTPPAGSNRLMVLIVKTHTNNTTATTITMTYGGVTATPAVNTANNQRRQVWIATLNEAQIAAAANNTITVNSNNIGNGYELHVATYAGVDQANPVTATGNAYGGTTTYTTYNFTTAINATADGYGVAAGVSSTAITSLGANETYGNYGQTQVGATPIYGMIADKAFPATTTTLPNLVMGTAGYCGVAGITLEPVACTDPDPSTITIPAGQTANGSPYDVSAKFNKTGDVGAFEYQVTTLGPATITNPQAWTNLYNVATSPVNVNYTVNAGTDRMLVIGVAMALSGTATASCSATYDSNAMVKAISDEASSTRQHTWLFYLKDTPASMDGTANPLTVTCSNNGGRTIRNLAVYGSVFAGVDQTATPLTDAKSYNSGGTTTTTPTFASALVENAGNQPVVIGMSDRTGSTAGAYTMTAATNWTLVNTQTYINTDSIRTGVLRRTIPATNTTDNRPFTINTASLASMAGMSLKPGLAPISCTNWTASALIPTTTAGGSLCGDYVDGGTYTLDVRGTDPDCGDVVTTTPVNFTWQSCNETATVNVVDPGVITGPTVITVTLGGAGGSAQQWSPDGGTNWYNSGAIYTPPTCASGAVTFIGRATGTCGTITDPTPVNGSYDTTDSGPAGDLATITVTPSGTVTGQVTVQATIGVETAPESLQNVVLNITGSTACNVSNGVMTWNAGSSKWEYLWDTSACGGPSPAPIENGVSVQVSGTDPDCNDFVTGSATVSIDNQCDDTTSTVSWTPPGTTVTAPLVVTAVLSGGTPGSQQVSFDDGTTWLPNGSTFTPVVDGQGTASFRVRALDVCGKYIYGGPYAVTWDGRLPRVRPLTMAATAAGKTSIQVIMTYCSDNNNNAQTSVSYKLTSAADLPANWTTVGPAVDGQPGDADGLLNQSVMFMLTGLTTDTSYDIKLTTTDVDGVDWTTIQSLQATAPPWTATIALSSWLDSPLLHNALRFACSTIGYADQASCEAAGGTWNLNRKWTGGWGVPKAQYPGAKYDGFECGTCHVKNSSNIKRVITAVAPKADGPFPGSTVALQDVREGTAEFGDDSDNHTSSNRVCEACHSQTTYHRQDTTAQTNKQHNNKADCVRCHEHNVGFRASCDSCHGTPPVSVAGLVTTDQNGAATTGSTTPGEHQKHAVDIGFDCKTCHSGWDTTGQMPHSTNINIGFDPSVNPRFAGAVNTIEGGTYEGRPSSGAGSGSYTAAGSGTPVATPATSPATVVTQDTATPDMTCAVYCHGYGRPVWNPTSTVACGSCHGGVGTGVGYRSGAPTGLTSGSVTSVDLSGSATGWKVGKHANHLDDSVVATGDPCQLCHYGYSYTDATHVNGTLNVRFAPQAGVSAVFTPEVSGVSPAKCSSLACHGGVSDWDTAFVQRCTDVCHGYPPNSTGTNQHATGVTPVNHDALSPTGVKDNHKDCQYCHGWNDNGSGTVPITPMTAAEVTAMNGDPTIVSNFKNYDGTSGYHNEWAQTNPVPGKITMNGDNNGNAADDASYDPATGGCDNSACHGNDAAHQLPVGTGSGNVIQFSDIGPGDCGVCHTSGVGGATIVTPTSPHTIVTKGGSFTGCSSCHSGHYAKVGGVQIPNNVTVGINYTKTGHGGIKLGGPGTDASISSKTTEAEICWGCHSLAANNISEFGTNNKMTGSPTYNQYNYGALSNNAASAGGWYAATTVGSETGATWTSAKTAFAYKTGAIQSTHTANSIEAGATSTVTGSAYAYKETLDKVALIRCSYCHDVHDAGGIGVGPTGKPYLRGTWWSNPYEEDGAPQSGTTFNNISEYGAVPRGGTSSTAHQRTLGGFWIDVNNVQPGTATTTALSGTAFANPTATGGTGTGGAWTVSDSAGLCTMCHTNNVDTMNWNTTETNLWFGTNGHSNAVIGGSGTASGNAANIFNLRGGTAANNSNPAMHFRGANAPGDSGTYGYRNNAGSAANYTPYISPTGESTRPYSVELWGTLSYDNTTTQNQYHKFPCAKCHNPHASRLPKLMITNCLDTKHNTWDDAYQLNTRNAAATSINYNRAISNWSTAQNCHRVGGIIPANRIIPATGGTYPEPVDTGALEATKGTTTDYKNRGWNTVTPW